MSQHLAESGWKLFRKTRPVALDRFPERALAKIVRTASSDLGTAHERYVVYELLQIRDKEVARGFDDLRRSQAITPARGHVFAGTRS
jgi:hypothetical protein